MSRRYRRPETKRLDISQGDHLVVKKHLTAGEQRAVFARMMRTDGESIDRTKVGISKMAEYLLDWSFEDAEGNPVVILGKSPDDVLRALDELPPEDFQEVLKAIEAHEADMEKERADAKNEQATANAS